MPPIFVLRTSIAEHWIVVPDVGGSNPLSHPTNPQESSVLAGFLLGFGRLPVRLHKLLLCHGLPQIVRMRLWLVNVRNRKDLKSQINQLK